MTVTAHHAKYYAGDLTSQVPSGAAVHCLPKLLKELCAQFRSLLAHELGEVFK